MIAIQSERRAAKPLFLYGPSNCLLFASALIVNAVERHIVCLSLSSKHSQLMFPNLLGTTSSVGLLTCRRGDERRRGMYRLLAGRAGVLDGDADLAVEEEVGLVGEFVRVHLPTRHQIRQVLQVPQHELVLRAAVAWCRFQ